MTRNAKEHARRLAAGAGALLFVLLSDPAAAQRARPVGDASAPRSAIVTFEERSSPNIVYQQESGGMKISVTRPVGADVEELSPAKAPAKPKVAASKVQPPSRDGATRRGVVADATGAKR